MKVYVTGYKGHVGQALLRAGFCPFQADVTNPSEVVREIQKEKPDLILHLAGKSDVDYCEKLENQKVVNSVNYGGTRNVFEAAKAFKTKAVFFSTDQIWKGGWFEGNYKEDSKLTEPVNQYGLSKLCAEEAVKELGGKIIRTSYLFDREREAISEKIFKLDGGEKVEAPTFIKRSFLYTQDFVKMISLYCKNIDKMPDVLHLSGAVTVSWYDFMKELARVYGYDKSLIVPRRWDSKRFTPRPHNGGLSTQLAVRLGFGWDNYMGGLVKMRHDERS